MRNTLADKIARDLQALFLAQEAGEVDAAEFEQRSRELSKRAQKLAVVQVGGRYCVVQPRKSRSSRR